jgi:hypothetical protein
MKNRRCPFPERGGVGSELSLHFPALPAFICLKWSVNVVKPGVEPMTKPGRRSASSLSVVPVYEPPRPEPPERLPDDAKQVWRDIVRAFRPTWFQGAETLLECYCQTVIHERHLAGMLDRYRRSARYNDLIRLYVLVVGCLASTATRLRMTPQSSRDSRHTKLANIAPRPWDPRPEPEPRPAPANVDQRWRGEPEPPAA